MGAARDVVLHQPLRIQRPQDAEHVHVSVGIKNVVNHTFEIKGVISIRHQVVFVGALELEAVSDSSFRSPVLPIAAEVHETLVISQLLEVFMVVSYYTVT